MSWLLDNYWRVTARAPRPFPGAHVDGDNVGAVSAKIASARTTAKGRLVAAVKRAEVAAKRALSGAKRAQKSSAVLRSKAINPADPKVHATLGRSFAASSRATAAHQRAQSLIARARRLLARPSGVAPVRKLAPTHAPPSVRTLAAPHAPAATTRRRATQVLRGDDPLTDGTDPLTDAPGSNTPLTDSPPPPPPSGSSAQANVAYALQVLTYYTNAANADAAGADSAASDANQANSDLASAVNDAGGSTGDVGAPNTPPTADGGGVADGGTDGGGVSAPDGAPDGGALDDGGGAYADGDGAPDGDGAASVDDGGDGVEPSDGGTVDDGFADDQGDAVVGESMKSMDRLRGRIRARRVAHLLGEDVFSDVEDVRADATFEQEITDPEPDFERARGSVHRGANYLHLTPGDTAPWTATSGQEGGTAPSYQEQESVDVFLGMRGKKGATMHRASDLNAFGAYGCGFDALGAATKKIVAHGPARGFVKKKTATGRVYTALVVNPTRAHDHQTSIANAHAAARRAVSVGKKLQAAAMHPATTVHGVVAHTRRRAARSMTKSQLLALAKAVTDAGNKLNTAADKHGKYISAAIAKSTKGAAHTKTVYGPSGKLGVRVKIQGAGIAASSALGAYCDMMGQDAPPAANPPDPSNPGFLMDGSPDPNAPPAPGGSTGDVTASDGTPGPPNYGMGAPPTPDSVRPVAGVDYLQDPNPNGDDQQVYDSTAGELPLGAIVYDATTMQPIPWQGIGSYTRFYPSGDNSDGHGPSGFQWGGGNPGIMDGWYWWWHGATAGTEYKHENAGNSLDDGYGSGNQSGPSRSAESVGRGWGPLIGNPTGWTKGLRYDRGKDQWFWYWDMAPPWAQQGGPNGLQAKYNQAVLDYKTQLTTAKANYAAAVAQDQLNAQNAAKLQQQQAAEDAAMQRQADVQQQQQALQQQQQEASSVAQAAQLDQQQAMLDMEAQKAQQQLDVQQAQVDLQLQQAQAAYAQQHPEAFFAPDQGPADQGDGGDYGDGGEPGATEGLSTDEARAVLEDDNSSDDGLVGDWEQGEGYPGSWRRGETVTGHMRGSDKIRMRRADRRG